MPNNRRAAESAELRKIHDMVAAASAGDLDLKKADIDDLEARLDRIEKSTGGAGDADDPGDFEEAVRRMQARNPNLTKHTAMTRARRTWPNLLAKFEREGVAARTMLEEIAKADIQRRNAPEARRFEKLCDAIQERDGCSRIDALRKAAREMNADELESYRRDLSE